MKLKLLTGASALTLGMLVASAASAADLTRPATMPTPDPGIVGYLDLHGGGEADTVTFEGLDPNTYSYGIIGGSGRGVIDISPTMSTQLDAWFDTFVESSGGAGSTSSDSGVAGHLTWHPSEQDSIGVLGSIGTAAYLGGIMGNVGIEAARDFGNWRLYGQAGVSRGLSGEASDRDVSDLYATLAADYFVDPNLMLSGNIGVDRLSYDSGTEGAELSWGAKVEFKPDMSPVSFYLSYEGFGWDDTRDGAAYEHAVEHTFLAGIRIPFGTDSLQNLQNRVGLSDMNPIFGDFTNH
ncbi:MAG: hypothetical protein P4M09_06260 [Devosia sp.]|nr:hypothetical protein [Devosia sp.]